MPLILIHVLRSFLPSVRPTGPEGSSCSPLALGLSRRADQVCFLANVTRDRATRQYCDFPGFIRLTHIGQVREFLQMLVFDSGRITPAALVYAGEFHHIQKIGCELYHPLTVVGTIISRREARVLGRSGERDR
ncbi:uncharacterized protein EI97DRAFT_207797 [Westerdykella ornata]|uniref:Uncharacterized protein n=1 Tax=Westerdykella ornata TaxID=318751 RepID=A0A6A6J7X1_WESOR|nr:uncharacterized protein EI97DRAFT_207797 [Westerdykella ornata]KAF2272502.1 hypothetical protein EI97DRAFT_207797 [Westerdykella ornata]